MGIRSETSGLVLYARNHREKDKLVKIFTEKYGKLMFFVRNGNRRNTSIASAILPFTEATYLAEINTEGLSFLNDAKEIKTHSVIQQDIFISAYGTYMLNLVDAAIEDQVYDPALFGFTKQALGYLDQGVDPEIITNIFEIQILSRFGLAFNWESCAICGETEGRFDFSSLYAGILCEKHFDRDHRRQHAEARAIHFIRMFAAIRLDQIQTIKLKQETKDSIRQTIDDLYDEFTGLNLKSKKFIDEMKSWENMIKPLEPRPNSQSEIKLDD